MISAHRRQEMLDLIHARYTDFGPTLAREKLVEKNGHTVSKETLRRWMIAEGLCWKPGVTEGVVGSPEPSAALPGYSDRWCQGLMPGNRTGFSLYLGSPNSLRPQ